MRTIMDALSIKPIDEKVMSKKPEFNKVSEYLDLKKASDDESELTEFCIFHDEAKLRDAISIIWESGFEASRISTYTSHDGSLLEHLGGLKDSKLGEGLLLGIVVGIIGGALFGWVVAPEFFTPFQTVPMPRFFNVFLSSVIWGFIGGTVGVLLGRSIPEYREKEYQTRLAEGEILVMVKAADRARARLARRILEDHGGVLVSPEQIKKAA